MSSPLGFLRAGPPPPKVALLPDAAFFTRALPVAAGATPAEAASQIELGLEAVSPFPLAQLYYGWFWPPGAERALVFAAYRRRFTTEQSSTWAGAEVVLPGFAAALGARFEPATTLLLITPEAITAVHWAEESAVPTRVLTQVFDPEATEDDRARVRTELVAAMGGSKTVREVVAPLAPDPANSDREIVFRSSDFVSRLSTAMLTAADVRDKSELAALRSAHRRDLVLWRATIGLAASLVLFGLGELALIGGRMWQRVNERQFTAQKPLVEKVTRIHEYTHKIEELATKRLMPLEMVTQLTGENLERKPPEIQFTRIQADQSKGLYTVFVAGRTSNGAQVNAYEAVLRKVPTIEKVDVPITGLRGDQTEFTLTAVFKPGSLVGPEPEKPPKP